METSIHIRNAVLGDEQTLAYIQTESWKEAFRGIVPADILSQCTKMDKTAEMYHKVLTAGRGRGYILEVNGRPHGIAWWGAARDEEMEGYAELICIHSLRDNWHKGYGKQLMERILEDIKQAGYHKMMLWVFDNNAPAISFYQSLGFAATGRQQPAFGAMEEMYTKTW